MMAKNVAEVMTRDPKTVEMDNPVSTAAHLMKDNDTGALIVTDHNRVSGIVTDRDITIRVLAEDKGADTPVREAYSGDIVTVAPETSVDEVIQLMRTKAVRRIPVVENDQAVGIVSIGDLALERDRDSALADISAAKGNK
jgi:CBS domain-containing protein